MQSSQFQQPIVVQEQRSGSNCLKPIVACIVAPFVLLACIGVCGVACLAAVALGSPDPLKSDFEPSEAQAQAYESSVQQAITSAATSGNNTFSVSVNEDEFASWLNYQYRTLAERYDEENRNVWEQLDLDFQVEFDNQQVALYVGTKLAIFDLAALVRAEVSVPEEELSQTPLVVDIISFKLGAIDVGANNQADFEQTLAEVLTDRLEAFSTAAGGTDVRLESVSAEDGVLVLTGRVIR